ncbi:MAG: DUF2062 domain-containing protein [Fuerstiella sp.]|jgi:hypothetical protein|nr:DUF2062 domain-containing protein [Fuerstiella sp.]MCP4511075.1 DUF2062 domain-containing protein [Fuerstiella sp.]
MWRQVLKLSASPRILLRSVLALDDSPHSIALGTSIGIFVGLTPSVGIQTILIVALALIFRRLVYFNVTAAMLSTYVSNPLTTVPMYYFWYRLGTWFVPGNATVDQFEAILDFEGLAGWWQATCSLAVQVGMPMLIGSLLIAPIGSVIAYPLTRYLVRWFRRTNTHDSGDQGSSNSVGGRVDEAHGATTGNTGETEDSSPATDTADAPRAAVHSDSFVASP